MGFVPSLLGDSYIYVMQHVIFSDARVARLIMAGIIKERNKVSSMGNRMMKEASDQVTNIVRRLAWLLAGILLNPRFTQLLVGTFL